jgi:hypothetical protein
LRRKEVIILYRLIIQNIYERYVQILKSCIFFSENPIKNNKMTELLCASDRWTDTHIDQARGVVVVKGLDIFRLGAIATDGTMIPSGNLTFMKRNLVGWLCVLNPEWLAYLWLMASVTWRGIILAAGLQDCGR